MDQDLIEEQPVEPLAHLLLGAFTEAGLLIARAEDREAARASKWARASSGITTRAGG